MHGRAGREKLPGKVIIQSYNPDNFSIQCARKQNYEMFYDTEISLRKQLKYPPFCDIIVIGSSSENENNIKKVSDYIYKKIDEKLIDKELKIFKPMPAPIDKIQNKYRWRMIIKGNMDETINLAINECLKDVYDKNIKDIRITVDVNPNNMMWKERVLKMAIRNLRYEGDEILKKKSRDVEVIDDKIQVLIDDMIETMHKYNGVGLAAVQVGILKKVVVIDLYDDKGPIVLINPVILKTKGEQEVDEGCLSFPNEFAKVIRPAEVTAEYTDRKGKRIKVKAKELLAQAICHEVDHLNGEVFIDKIIPGTLEYVEPEKE